MVLSSIPRLCLVLSLCVQVSACADSEGGQVEDAFERALSGDGLPLDSRRSANVPLDAQLDALELTDRRPSEVLDTSSVEPERQSEPCPSVMALIPAGAFDFGPGPLATTIDHDYCVDLFEVTAAEFKECVADAGCEGYEEWPMCQELDVEQSPNQCFEDRGEFAANYIDWYRAHAYCQWAGKRLPTTQEWERAARGDVGFTYPWGEDPLDCERAHQGRGSIFDSCLDYQGLANRPVEVGNYVTGVSPYGLFDGLGNVKEWIDIREDRSVLPQDGDKAQSRGGAYNEGEWLMTTLAYDGQLGPQITSQGHGFRCVSDPLPGDSD